jgi:hypothetical protein
LGVAYFKHSGGKNSFMACEELMEHPQYERWKDITKAMFKEIAEKKAKTRCASCS